MIWSCLIHPSPLAGFLSRLRPRRIETLAEGTWQPWRETAGCHCLYNFIVTPERYRKIEKQDNVHMKAGFFIVSFYIILEMTERDSECNSNRSRAWHWFKDRHSSWSCIRPFVLSCREATGMHRAKCQIYQNLTGWFKYV